RTLLHGDVVHHNFMFGKDDVKLVDFDLAAMGKKSDELILWAHRVLPNVDYDLKSLMKQHPYLQHIRKKEHYLLYPNEIMRESLFYLKLAPRQKQGCYPFIKKFAGDVLLHEKKLTQMISELA
ncbi:MAG: serine/threonine protein kinase, partial [Solibacillus sp.]